LSFCLVLKLRVRCQLSTVLYHLSHQ